MAGKSPRPVRDWLRSAAGNRGLQGRLALHQRLLTALRQCLPSALRDHCLACVFGRDGTLILYTDSPAWATQLRYLQPRLLPALTAIAPVTRLRTRVLPPSPPPAMAAAQPRVPPPEIVAQLRQQVAWVADEGVRTSLLRLLETWCSEGGEG
ncbi:DUF721 domain-containing protein [Methylomarinovum caldicuralii]|uniref:DUF721 domain-containing protein n=1 Tax=Methylomarinovum caldicuralii TaxID=438856 RepID=UPI0029534A7D|nr:DUF721 domain-containing protein [Methylomarinovum caldicuralii]